jgi:hypothetical protein
MRIALILAALLAALPVQAADADPAPPQKENIFKRIGKAIGKDARAGAKQAGKAYGDLGRSVGRGTVSATKQVGKEIKDSSKKTVKEAKETF